MPSVRSNVIIDLPCKTHEAFVVIQNRAFQQVSPGSGSALNAWQAVNGASLRVIRESVPVSSALPNALQVDFPNGRSGGVGFANTGFGGISYPCLLSKQRLIVD